MLKSSPISLIDTAYQHTVDVWAVFRDVHASHTLMRRWLKPRFGHVEIWKYVPPGAWLRFDTSVELIVTEVFADPPWKMVPTEWNPTFIHARRAVKYGRFREPMFAGPITCVELAKAFLGIRSFFVRTPYQLYKYLKREG